MMAGALSYIENFPEDPAISLPDIGNALQREWRKQTEIIKINSTDENDKNVPGNITYNNGYPFIRYYEDDQSGRFGFAAAIPDYENSYTRLYLGAAYMDDLKKEGGPVYDFNRQGRHLTETFYNNQSRKVIDVCYKYENNIPFPVITKYKNGEYEKEDFYSNLYINTGQRFWLYDSTLELDKNDRWIDYNGNLFNSYYLESGTESYNTPVFNEDGKDF